MKRVLFVVVVCFFTASWQQQRDSFYPSPYLSPYAHPFFAGLYNDHYEALAQRFYRPQFDYGYQQIAKIRGIPEQVEARRISLNNNRNKDVIGPENRGFGILGLLGYNYASRYLPYTLTTTSYVVSTTNITVGSLATCYLSAIFADAKKACRRKRDEAAASEMLGLFDEGRVEPSQVDSIQVVPTASVDDDIIDLNEGRSNNEITVNSSDLKSSMDEVEEKPDEKQVSSERLKRFTIQTKVITSTTTSTNIITNAVTTTIDTAFAAAAKVLCVPSGWKVC